MSIRMHRDKDVLDHALGCQQLFFVGLCEPDNLRSVISSYMYMHIHMDQSWADAPGSFLKSMP
jgi:hypothetical protein